MINTYMDIPGQTTEYNLNNIYKIAEEVKQNCKGDKPKILEIGCAWGRSTWALLDAYPDCEHHIIENWAYERHNHYQNEITQHPSYKLLKDNKIDIRQQRKVWKFFVSQHKNYKNIVKLNSMSSEDYIAQCMDKEFDFVFLDGSHEYDTVIKELYYFKKALVLYGDDYRSTQQELVKAVNEYYEDHIKYSKNQYLQLQASTPNAYWCIWDSEVLGNMCF